MKIHEWYAAVEGGLAHNPPGKEDRIGSFGKPNFFMYRMKIVDENDQEVGPFRGRIDQQNDVPSDESGLFRQEERIR